MFPAVGLGVPIEALKTPATPEPASPNPAPFRVGAIFALSGANAALGHQLRQAVELSIADIQSKGELAGREVELIVLDSGLPPAEGSSPKPTDITQHVADLVKELVLQKNVQVIIGDATPELSQPLVTLANTYRTMLISPTLRESLNLPENTFAFGLYPRQIGMLTATNRFFEINSKVKSIAVFCDSSQRGSAFSLMLRDVARSRQVRILSENCSSEVGSDNRAGVLRAQAENPDAVIIDRDLEQISNLMQKFGWGAPVLTTNLLADVLARGTSPPGLVDGVFSVGWNIESSFVRKFQGTYGVVPNFTAALAYDAVQLAAVSYASSPDDMRAGLKRIRSQGVAGRYDFTVEQAGNGQQAKLLRFSQGASTEQ
jgi:branched-chain amino acid transport system substrate-binding protein